MKLTITSKYLKIFFSLQEKLLGFHGNFTVPRNHVKKIHHTLPKKGFYLRCPGTYLPWIITAGTYYVKRKTWEREFWYYQHHTPPIVIELRDEKYDRLVINVTNSASQTQ